jgi:hypothetical protein
MSSGDPGVLSYNISDLSQPNRLIYVPSCSVSQSIRDPSTRQLIVECFNGAVLFFNETDSTRTTVLTGANAGVNIIWKSDTRRMYVTASTGAWLTRILTAQDGIVSTLFLGACDVQSMALDRMTASLYLGCSAHSTSNGLAILRGRSQSTILTLAECPDLNGIGSTLDGVQYASCQGSNTILAVSGTIPTPLPISASCDTPNGMAVNERTGLIALTCAATPSGVIIGYGNTTNATVVLESTMISGLTFTRDDMLYLSVSEYDELGTNLYRYDTRTQTLQVAYRDHGSYGSLHVETLASMVYIAAREFGVLALPANGTIDDQPLEVISPSVCTAVDLTVDELRSTVVALCLDRVVEYHTLTRAVRQIPFDHPIPLTHYGRAIALNPVTHLIYLLLNDVVTVFDTRTLRSWSVPPSECVLASQVVIDRTTGVVYVACTSLIALADAFRCPPGFEFNSGACSVCNPGAASGPIDQTPGSMSACRPCSSGTIAPRTGSATCTPCSIGRYADLTFGQVCSACPPGRFQNSSGNSDCAVCPIGFYAPTALAVSCDACPAGTYAQTNESVVCFPCQLGSAQANPGQPACEPCPSGSYADQLQMSTCELCRPGSYASSNASSVCTYCARHSATAAYGLNVTCPDCLGGTQQLLPGGTTCSLCDLGQYATPGDPCSACTLNTYSPRQGVKCVSCEDSDQVGLVCVGGLARVKSGWWAFRVNDSASGEAIYRTTECPPDFCPGSMLQQPSNDSLPVNTTAKISPLCTYPRANSPDNWLCAECESGYIAWGPSCDSCTGVNGGLVALVLLFCVAVVGFLLRSGSSSAGHLTILMFFSQTCGLELGSISDWLSWLRFANLSANSTHQCLAPLTPLQQQLLTFMTPFILMMILSYRILLSAASGVE